MKLSLEKFYERVNEVLDQYGWHKGSMGSPQEGHCLLGAMRYVAMEERYGEHVPERGTEGWANATYNPQIENRLNEAAVPLADIIEDEVDHYQFHAAFYSAARAVRTVFTYNDDVAESVEDVKLMVKKAAHAASHGE